MPYGWKAFTIIFWIKRSNILRRPFTVYKDFQENHQQGRKCDVSSVTGRRLQLWAWKYQKHYGKSWWNNQQVLLWARLIAESSEVALQYIQHLLPICLSNQRDHSLTEKQTVQSKYYYTNYCIVYQKSITINWPRKIIQKYRTAFQEGF